MTQAAQELHSGAEGKSCGVPVYAAGRSYVALAGNPNAEGKSCGVPVYAAGRSYVALAGNPNSGKTTAFNAYTGARQHVGNYPGVTVERKEGMAQLNGEPIRLMDLPGTYSLTAYSMEEIVVRRELTEHPPLAVIDVIDASALERNLFLTVQLLELGLPVVLALNMMDEARASGVHIDVARLSERLGAPVAETVARTGEGLSRALAAAMKLGHAAGGRAALNISYGPDLDPVLAAMTGQIERAGLLTDKYPARWLALKILEGDTVAMDEARAANGALAARLAAQYDAVAAHIRATLKTSPDAIISDYRYGFVRGLLKDGVMRRESGRDRLALSDKIDKVLVNPLLGPLVMIGVLYLVFQATFVVGAYPQGWVEDLFGWLGGLAASVLPEGRLQSLVVSGVIDGLGGVLSFVPLILILFVFIAFLEDSGYMARIAYMVDRIFRAFGLHGSSVMAYITAGGIAGAADRALLDAIGAGRDFQDAVAQVKADLPLLAAPRESSPRNLNGWVGMPSPAALIASLIVDEAAEQRTANRSVIRSQGELIAVNMEEQADKMEQGATQKFACAVAGAVVNMASGIASIGVGAAGIKSGADAQSVAAKSQAVSSIISSAGNIISAGGDYAQSLRSAEAKRLEADAERIRTSMELTKQTNEAMRDLIAKALDFMNSMQANMNQTRTKILG